MSDTVEIIVKLTDKVSQPAKKVEKELTKFQKAEKKTQQSLKTGKAAWGAYAAAAGAAVAAVMAAKKAFDLGAEGAQLTRLKEAGEKLAASYGQSMESITASMKDASRGSIADMALISAANRSLILGVTKTPEEFEKLTTAAVALGRAMGLDATKSIDDIITGIGRMSPLILDNLGITLSGGQGFRDYAEQIGKAVDELTDAEKKQALLNAAMKSAAPLLDENGKLVDDTASSYEKLTTRLKNASDEAKMGLGETLKPLIDTINEGWQAADLLSAAQERGQFTSEGWAQSAEAAMIMNMSNAEAVEFLTQANEVWARQLEASLSVIDPLLLEEAESADRAMKMSAGFAEVMEGVDTAVSGANKSLLDGKSAFKDWSDNALAAQLVALKWRAAIEDDGFISESEIRDIENLGLALGQDVVEGVREAADNWNNFNKQIEQGDSEIQAIDDTLNTFIDGGPYEVDFFINVHGDIPVGGNVDFTVTDSTPKKSSQKGELQAGGGMLPLGRAWALVGDPGPYQELISPEGRVYDHKRTKKILDSGMINFKSFFVPEGPGNVVTTPLPKLKTTSARDSAVQQIISGGGGSGGGGEIIGGGGGGSGGTNVAQIAIAAVAEIVPSITATIVPVVAQVQQQQLRSQAQIAESNARIEALLAELVEVSRAQGTSADTGQQVQEALQFGDFS